MADEGILREINKRIDNINIDGVLDIKYIQELIDDKPLSIFEVSGNTEKPDVLAAKLLEGRIGILLDGTPSVMTVPFLFIENFQSGQDYYTNYYYATIIRLLRLVSSLITTGFPAIYLSLVTYHREVLPTPMLLSILSSRQGVPFPTVVELIGLLLVFEILIEAGSRMPNYIGQALSIVGALVLGSAAVEAKIVSSAMIIVVGISSITGLIIPNFAGIFIILRTLFILFSAAYGIYGYIFGMVGLFIHLFSLKSFDVPYMATINSLYPKNLKDTIIRAPRWFIAGNKFGGKKNEKKLSIFIALIISIIFLTGCWDYSEIEDLAIVAGMAIDIDANGSYIINVEIVDIKPTTTGIDLAPIIIETRGETVFEALRNIISTSLKRIRWSHASYVVVSKEVAEQGLSSLLDWIARHPEARLTLHILISRENTAKEVILKEKEFSKIRALEFEKFVDSSEYLSKFPPHVEVYELINKIENKDNYPILPTTNLININNEVYSQMEGSAYFIKDKLAGFFLTLWKL